jgi:hypothetical protein
MCWLLLHSIWFGIGFKVSLLAHLIYMKKKTKVKEGEIEQLRRRLELAEMSIDFLMNSRMIPNYAMPTMPCANYCSKCKSLIVGTHVCW